MKPVRAISSALRLFVYMYGNGDNHGDDYDHYHGDEDDDSGGGGDSMAICYLLLCAILGCHHRQAKKRKKAKAESALSEAGGAVPRSTKLYLERTSTYID